MTVRRLIDKYEETAGGCDLDLSDNTNLWGVPPSLEGTVASFAASGFARYPAAYSNDLKSAIARRLEVRSDMVVAGCGSDDILDTAIRALGRPGDIVAQLDPSFSMMRVFARVSGLSVRGITAAAPDLTDEFVNSGARLLYLCSPNNPTGGVLDPDVIESIVSRARGIVIIDEAYIDFGGTSSLPLLRKYHNVLITRTFSKAFGLAAFRVGYGIGSPRLMQQVEAARGPYKVTALSERVAIEALESDTEWVRQRAADAVANRERFAEELKSIGLEPLESRANFVLVPVSSSARFESQLRDRGIAVRRFDALIGIGDALRISIGPWPLMQRCLDALREIVV